MCSGLFDTLPLNELTCMGSKGSLFSLSKMQLENATALFVVEVYCSGAKSKVVLRSELTLKALRVISIKFLLANINAL